MQIEEIRRTPEEVESLRKELRGCSETYRIVKESEAATDKAIRKITELYKDWYTISCDDFEAKWGSFKDLGGAPLRPHEFLKNLIGEKS